MSIKHKYPAKIGGVLKNFVMSTMDTSVYIGGTDGSETSNILDSHLIIGQSSLRSDEVLVLD